MKCERCGKEFEPRRPNQKYCSADCREASRNARYRESHRETRRQYAAAHKEQRQAQSRRYYLKHREEILAKRKIYDITGEWPK